MIANYIGELMIEIKNLSFRYENKFIYNDFNLVIPKNQVCLVTGINGVGKSTLLRLIAGVLKPKTGEIIFTENMGDDPRRSIGFISDKLSLYKNLTVAQAIDFHKSVYRLDEFDDSMLKHTRIDYRQKIKSLSVGQQTIVHLNLIFSTKPKILLIDEVIVALDAYLKKVVLQKLLQLITESKLTVIMVNLNFHDIEPIVERVILLKDGRVLVDEKIDDLKQKVKKIKSDVPPGHLPILSRSNFNNSMEYFIYPFNEEYRKTIEGEIVDLNLTDIVSGFIGGEYA